MEELFTDSPLLGGVIAIIAVYVIYKLIGVLTFFIRLGLAVAIGAAIFYYFTK